MMINIIGNAIGAGQSTANPAFVMEVDTTIAGATPNNQFQLRTQATDTVNAFDYDLTTSDGQSFTGLTGNITITFPTPGIYTLKITGKFGGVKFGQNTEGAKVTDILNWGDWEKLQWIRCNQGLQSCSNLTTLSAKDTPYLGNLDSLGLRNFFAYCTNFNSDISDWDVSTVTDFGSLFFQCVNFNQPLNSWDMSSAQQISNMFFNCNAFNQDLNNWNTSSVTAMSSVFDQADAFNGDVSTWDTSNVNGSMFRVFHRTSFNGDLSNWDVSGVTNFRQFVGFTPFNNDSVSNWAVGTNCTSLSGMFAGTPFNQDLSSWNTSNVQNFESTFSSCPFNNNSISNWNTSSATNMSYMFYNNDFFNQDIGSWDVSNVTTMQGMFQDRGATSTSNLNISNWTTTSLTNTYQMFRGSNGNTTDLSNWDMSNVTDAREMFVFGGMTFDPSRWNIQGAVNLQSIFNQSQNSSGVVGLWTFNNWNISQAISITSMLGSNVITTAAYDATLIAWAAQVPTTALTLNVNSTQYTLGGEAEAARTALINTYGWTISDGGGAAEVPFVFDATPFAGAGTVTIRTQAGFTYDYDVSVSTGESFTNQTGDLAMTFGDNVTRTFTVSGLFPGFKCENDASARFQVQTWGSQPWRSLYAAFWHPTITLTSVGSDIPNLFLCDSLYQTFRGVISFPASNNLSQWKTSQVTNFRGCFRDGTGGLNNIDVTNWDTGKATVMMEMFSNNFSDWSLTSTDVSQWNTRNVTIFQQMFYNNYTFNQPIQNWDVRSAAGNAFQSFLSQTTTNLGQFNQPLGSWNINPSNYGSNFFRDMFYGQNAFDQDLSAWTITGFPNSQGNFNNFITNADLVARPMSFSRANYDKLLISWGNQGFLYPEIISFGNAQYTLGGAAEAARNTLINTYGWTITDGGGI
jgi:surface protein